MGRHLAPVPILRRVVAYGGDGSSSYDTGHQTQTQSRFVAYGSGGTDSQRPGYQTQSQGRVVAYGGSGSNGGQEQSSQTHSQRVVGYGGGGTTNEGHTSQTNSQRVVAYGGGSAPRQGLDSQTHSQRVVAYGSSNPSNQGQGSQTHSQQVVAYSGGTGGSDTSYQPSGSSTSYQPSGSCASYQPSRSGTSYQPSGSGASYQPSGLGTSYQPRGSGTFYQPTGSRTRTSTGRGNYYRTYSNSRPRGSAGRSRQYVDTPGRIVYTGGSTSTSGSVQPGSNGISYQNGRYYDAAGHEVDQYGRHLGGSGGLVGSTSNGEACCDDSTSQGLPSTYNPIISQISDDPVSLCFLQTSIQIRVDHSIFFSYTSTGLDKQNFSA